MQGQDVTEFNRLTQERVKWRDTQPTNRKTNETNTPGRPQRMSIYQEGNFEWKVAGFSLNEKCRIFVRFSFTL